MGVSRLGYLGFEVSDLEAWRRFAADGIGAEVGDHGDGFAVRIDDHRHRILVQPGSMDDLAWCGFECDSDAQLEGTVSELGEAGFSVKAGDEATCAHRGVKKLYHVVDPDGLPLELFTGPDMAEQAFKTALIKSHFVTGEAGASHIVCGSDDAATRLDFYKRYLGFRESDVINTKFADITFLHVNERHHTLAIVNRPLPKRIDHFMLEVASMEDVGYAHDRMLKNEVPITRSLGQHPNDRMFSFYCRTPSGFDMEFGWGGVKVDDTTWQTTTYAQTSLWGHQRARG